MTVANDRSFVVRGCPDEEQGESASVWRATLDLAPAARQCCLLPPEQKLCGDNPSDHVSTPVALLFLLASSAFFLFAYFSPAHLNSVSCGPRTVGQTFDDDALCTAELSGPQSPQFMVSLHRMREIRFLASRRRVCVASRYRSAAATPVQWPCLVPRLPECGLAVVGGGMATANKADMSWLLNRTDESGSHGQGPVDARASGTSSQWNEQAPMLYRLAAHASSSDLAGGIGAILTVADHAGPTTNTSPARPHQGSGTHPHPLRLHQAEQPREPLCRTSSPDSQGSNDTVLAGNGTKQEGDENRRKSCAIALDESLAIQIYASRPRNAGSKYGSMAAAVRLGERHGVSPKTIRDIWNRKSWVKVTRAYWTAAEESAYVPRRHRASSPQGSRTGSSKRCGRGRESKAG